jgi:hypothetical protein
VRFSSENRALEVIPGNPLAVRGNPDKSQPHLALVWSQPVAKRNGQQKRASVTPHVEPKTGISAWLNRYSGALNLLSVVVVVVLTVFNVGNFFGGQSATLNQLTKDVDGLKSRVSNVENQLARIEGKVDGFLNRAKALELGLKDPQVAPIKLYPTATSQVIENPHGKIPYSLKLTFKEITKDEIVFFFSGTVGSNTLGEDNRVGIPRQIGPVTDLLQYIHMPGMPHILMTILDFPTKDSAIIAIGLKAEEVKPKEAA